MDLALVAHAATLRSRVPFLHFFDGFRTSHEIDKIALLTDADIAQLIREDDVIAFRSRGMTPDAPVVRGTAQNPDVFFQAREAANPFHLAVPGVVAEVFEELAERTGRRYGLVEYHGAIDADRVVVVMGSAAGALEETVDDMGGARGGGGMVGGGRRRQGRGGGGVGGAGRRGGGRGRAGRHAAGAALPAVPERGAGRGAPAVG